MFFTLLLAAVSCAIDVLAFVTGRFALTWKSLYWLKDSEGSVILPFQYDFDNATESNRLWMMAFLCWSASAAFCSIPLLYYYGMNRFRASGWAVSWANLVAVLAAGRVALLTAVSYIFHFKFLQELAKSAESLSLSEIFELYRLKIIGFVVPGLSLNALAGALLLVMLIVSLRDTKQWRRLNVRKIY
jgi:hypothetical protein